MVARNFKTAPANWQACGAKALAMLTRFFSVAKGVGNGRRLRLCETLSLGEKRFLAILECDHRTYLLAGTPDSVALLQCLDDHSQARTPGDMSSRDHNLRTSQ
jgi:flagellar biogenesis protein FliO